MDKDITKESLLVRLRHNLEAQEDLYGKGDNAESRLILESLHAISRELVEAAVILLLEDVVGSPLSKPSTIQIMLDAVETLQERYQSVMWRISGDEVYISVSNISWSADETHVAGPKDGEPVGDEATIRQWVESVTQSALNSESWRNEY